MFLQVSENGVISFGDKWFFDKPKRFPTRDRNIQNRYVVAPFWSDNDIRRAGTVRYVLIENGTNPIVQNVTALIQREHNQNFQANTMLIAQWDHVHPYPHGSLLGDQQDESLSKVTRTVRTVYYYTLSNESKLI